MAQPAAGLLSAIVQAKRKYLEMLQEKQNLEADKAELQQKYAQKAQQARKLQDMFQMVRESLLAPINVYTIDILNCLMSLYPLHTGAQLALPLQVQQERDMLQSSHRAGAPSRGENAQPFGGHPAKGRDGSNVVRPANTCLQSVDIRDASLAAAPVGALKVARHRGIVVICAGDNNPQEAGFPGS